MTQPSTQPSTHTMTSPARRVIDALTTPLTTPATSISTAPTPASTPAPSVAASVAASLAASVAVRAVLAPAGAGLPELPELPELSAQTLVADAIGDAVTDVERLRQIGRYDFDSPSLKAAMMRFAIEAAQLMDLPIGLVSIVTGGAQFFVGCYGIEGTWMADTGGTPVEWSFCANAVRSGDPYVVEDAHTDELQHDNPLVLLDGIRSYAGVPLITPSGHVLGTCCTIGNTMREFTPAEITALEGISARIVQELNLHLLD